MNSCKHNYFSYKKRKSAKKQQTDGNGTEAESGEPASKAARQESELPSQPIASTQPSELPSQPTVSIQSSRTKDPTELSQTAKLTKPAGPTTKDKPPANKDISNQIIESPPMEHTAEYVSGNEQNVSFGIGDIVIVGGDYTFDYSYCRVDDVVFDEDGYQKAVVTYFVRDDDKTLKPLQRNPNKKNSALWTDEIHMKCIVMGFRYKNGDIVTDEKVVSIKELMSTIFGD